MKTTACAILGIIGMLVFHCSCTQPTQPLETTQHAINVEETGEALLATVAVQGGILEVRARDLTWEPDHQIVSIDVFLVNMGVMPINAPVRLVLPQLDPEGVELVNPDGGDDDGLPFKVFDEEFGDDGVLYPNESSGAGDFVFTVGEHRSFSVHCRLEQVPGSLGAISGVVFRDLNHNEVQDDGEPGLGNVVVHLGFGEAGDGMSTRTGSMGEYAFSSLNAGVYTVLLEVPNDAKTTTENPLVITLNEDSNGDVEVYDKAHFGIVYRVDPLIIEYDFEDGRIPNWGGNADMAIVNGTLELISTHQTQWRWRWKIFDYQLPARYWRGSFEFKAKFGEQGHFFNLKGHSESDIFDHNFGPFVYFKGNIVRPKEGDVSVITEFTYIPGNWYRIRINFDNGLGEKGRYVLHYQDLTSGGPELKVGEFDYFASNGRLADIAEFGFGISTFGEVASSSFFIDDVRLEVRPASGTEKLTARSSY